MAEILIPETDARVQYVASSGQTVFAYNFPIFDEGHLTVIQTDSLGVSTTLTIATHYTVSGVGASGGGNVTLITGAVSGDIVTIQREVPAERNTDFNVGGDYRAESINRELDLITMVQQQQGRDLTRTMALQPEDVSTSAPLPLKADRANKFLVFDADGNPSASAGSGTDTGLRSDLAADNSLVGYKQGGAGSTLRTVKNKLQDSISVKDFGAIGDGVTDDTAAIQTAINYAATSGLYSVHVPAGHYIVSTLYFYYDASLNPGYPSSTYSGGRFSLIGDRSSDYSSTVFGLNNNGTVIETNSTTGSAIITGTSAFNTVHVELKNMGIVGSTSGDVLLIDGSPQLSNFENLFVRNSGTGNAVNVTNGCWTSSFRNIYATCEDTGGGTKGDGVAFKVGTCGLSIFENITASFAATGIQLGVSGEPFGAANVVNGIQSTHCLNGIIIYGAEATNINGVWCEQGSGEFDFKISGNSRRVSVSGLYCVSTALTLASVVLGDNTGTVVDDSCDGVVINTPALGYVGGPGVYGILKYAGCGAITINHPSFKNNGGIAIGIDTSGTITPTIVNFPDWFPYGASSTMPSGQRVRSLTNGNSQQRYLVDLNTQENEAVTSSGIATTAITGAVDNGAGLVRITSTAHLMNTGDMCHIESVGGTTEANGEWVVTVIDANTFDLVGSTFTNTYTTGGTALKYALDLSQMQWCPSTIKALTTTGDVYIRLPNDGGDGRILSVYKQYVAGNVVFTSSSAVGIDGSSSLVESGTATRVLVKVSGSIWTVLK